MDSFTIACTGKSSILESKFFPPIQLDGKYQIGLKNLYSYNAIFNIKEPHNVLYYYEEKKVVIPKQTVTIDQIKSYVSKLGILLNKNDKGFGYSFVGSDQQSILNKGLVTKLKHFAFDDINVEDDIYYFNPKEKKEIIFPPGVYEIQDIAHQIKEIVPGTFLTGDTKSLKCVLYSPAIFDFNTEGFGRSLLGFRGLTEANKKVRSETRVNINNTNVIRVHCNIASGSYLNGHENHAIYDFFPVVPPGYKMVEVPSNIIYYPIDVDAIDTFTVSFRDQNNELIDFNEEEVTVNFHIKKIG